MMRKLRMRDSTMNELVQEAVKITNELGEDVTFVGALAVYMYTRTQRSTSDLDFAIAHQISDEELISKQYNRFTENGKEVIRTPRGRKIDIYTNDVGDVPVSEIIRSAKVVKAGSGKKSPSIKIASLEVLVCTKYRANRPQDQADLKTLTDIKYNKIDWRVLKTFTKDQLEYDKILSDITRLRELN
jgi:hypothetical protein